MKVIDTGKKGLYESSIFCRAGERLFASCRHFPFYVGIYSTLRAIIHVTDIFDLYNYMAHSLSLINQEV